VRWQAGRQMLVLAENDPAVAHAVIAKLKLAEAGFAVADAIGGFVTLPTVPVRTRFLKYLDLSGLIPREIAQFAALVSMNLTSVGRFLLAIKTSNHLFSGGSFSSV
jgi:sulfite reductase alpha subunit-like flavoprotein